MDNHLDAHFVTPRSLLPSLFPGPSKVDFEHVLAHFADFDTVERDGPAKHRSQKIVLDGALLKVGNVEAYQ